VRKRESEREKERESERKRAREREGEIECEPACVYEQCSFLSEEPVRERWRERERDRDRESIHTYMKRIYCGIMERCV